MIRINLLSNPKQSFFDWHEGEPKDVIDQKAECVGIVRPCEAWPQCDMWYSSCDKCGHGNEEN